MADRVPLVKRVAPIPRKASPKQDSTSPPRRQTPSTPSVLPAWLGGHYAMLAGAAAALLIVAIVFTSAWAAYSWLAHRSSSRAAAHHETTAVPSIPVVQAAPVAPVAKPELPAQPVIHPSAPDPAPAVASFKRLDLSGEEELRKQLLLAPEIALDSVPKTSTQLHTLAERASKRNVSFPGPVGLLPQRPDLQGLPLRKGADCQISKENAEHLEKMSRQLRALMDKTRKLREAEEQLRPGDRSSFRPDSYWLREALLDDSRKEWRGPEAVPCLVQMLQVENAEGRTVLVEMLSKIPDKSATLSLAKRAMADLNPEVRAAATRELLNRPRADYRPLLLTGLRYPWQPVAQHAAETLAFVKDTAAVPQIEEMLGQSDPTLPFTIRQGDKETLVVREVVRINHLSNCLLCHPGSFARTDPVRGRVPTPGEALPEPLNSPQYYDGGTILVRADTTYLRQDFSVMQPVVSHGQWPEQQRFDYLVRTRPATLQEQQVLTEKNRDRNMTASRQAMLFALREITGKEYQSDGSVQAATP